MTSPLIPSPLVTAPIPIRRRYGVFDAANGPMDLPAHGAGGGVRYVPDSCGEALAYGVTCYNTDNPAPEKPTSSDFDEVSTGVFVVLTSLTCSAVGYTPDELRAKVRSRLENGEQATVESAFWTGEDFEGNDLGILNLDGAAQDIAAGYDAGSIIDVVAALERHAYVVNGYGSAAYIHAPVEVAAHAANAGLILPDGARKVTPMGSVWAFGAYPSGEVIVTGQTALWRSPETQVYDAFDTTTNERLLVAEREYAVSFDCFAGRAGFDPLEVTSP
jgi:hypothetical protein